MPETLPGYPVVQQLYRLFLTNATGRIDFVFFDEKCHLWLKNGCPVAAEFYNKNISPLQIAVEISLLKQQDATSIEISSSDTIFSLKDKLIQSGLMDENNFSLLMKEKLKRELAVLCLSKNEATFTEGEECPESYLSVAINGFGALFFIFQFYSTPEQINNMEKEYNGSTLIPNANFNQVRMALDLPPHLISSLDKWSEPRSLSDLYMVSGLNHREVVAIVAILKLVNALDIKNSKANCTFCSQNKEQTNIKPSLAPQPTSRATQKKVEAPEKNTDRKKQEKDKQLLDDAKAHIESLNTHNPLVILDVNKDSSPSEIKKAYAGLARKFHPDRLSGSSIEHLKKDFEKLFAEIGNAYQTLIKEDLRKEFFECLNDPVIKGNLQKLDQRKRAIYEKQKTEILFKKRDYKQTISTARRALSIFPFDPEILIMLGWSIFNTTEDKQKAFENSAKYFDRALKILPTFSDGHYFKGLVYKAIGAVENAKAEFNLAVKYDPENKEAVHELHGL